MSKTPEQLQHAKQQRIAQVKSLYEEYSSTSKDAAALLVIAHVLKDLGDEIKNFRFNTP